MIPARFITEYPSRCMKLFEVMEGPAREKEMIGSFSLIVAASVFLIPYERMKSFHPLHNQADEVRIYAEIRQVERQKFLEANFWSESHQGIWRFSRVMGNINQTKSWQDESGMHPLQNNARNSIQRRKVKQVLRVIRNALAHGNVVYLNENGFEAAGEKVQYLAFLSRCEEPVVGESQPATYQLVTVTEEGFLDFVKAWAKWLAQWPQDSELEQAIN